LEEEVAVVEEGGVHFVQKALSINPHPGRHQFKEIDLKALYMMFENK
jgi:hypothetical protein